MYNRNDAYVSASERICASANTHMRIWNDAYGDLRGRICALGRMHMQNGGNPIWETIIIHMQIEGESLTSLGIKVATGWQSN